MLTLQQECPPHHRPCGWTLFNLLSNLHLHGGTAGETSNPTDSEHPGPTLKVVGAATSLLGIMEEKAGVALIQTFD